MKGILIVIFMSLLAFFATEATAQIKVDLEKKVNREANQRANRTTDKALDKTFDKVEEGIGDLFKKKDKKQPVENTEAKAPGEKSSQNTNPQNNPDQKDKAPETKPQPQLTWNRYDFIPGTEIIFEDNFTDEQNGEFPSRWDMSSGGLIENTVVDGENVVFFKKTNANGTPDGILPLLKNRKEDYLPEEFTFEMDCYFGPEPGTGKYNGGSDYYVFLYDGKNQAGIMTSSKPIRISYNKVHQNLIGDTYPGHNSPADFQGWRHVSISFNKRALKGYLDDTRLLNIPNCEFNPTGIMISYHNVAGIHPAYIKNIRIAKGAVPLYDKFLTDGKFVTTGIKFDVNKATIRPESMGTIAYVVKMMTEHPELNFSVEGHTDSDGEDAFNQKLSEARSLAVMDQMAALGIGRNRLKSRGWGESKPMAGNDTPEGKAQNRRVEFVKF